MKSRKISFLLKIVALSLVVYGTFTLVTMHREISAAELKKSQTIEAIAETESSNARLEDNIAALDTDEGKAAVARRELGYVSQGEMVFKEIGG